MDLPDWILGAIPDNVKEYERRDFLERSGWKVPVFLNVIVNTMDGSCGEAQDKSGVGRWQIAVNPNPSYLTFEPTRTCFDSEHHLLRFPVMQFFALVMDCLNLERLKLTRKLYSANRKVSKYPYHQFGIVRRFDSEQVRP